MNAPAFVVLTIMCAFAVGNWIAVLRVNKPLEYVCKPVTTLALLGVAVLLEPFDDTVQLWFVAALGLSLVGDVLLMLARDLFLEGLLAFALAHGAYIAGMAASDELEPERLGVGTVVSLAVLGLVGLRIAAGAFRSQRQMTLPVVVYMLIIAAMLVAAVGMGRPAAVVGAGFFVASDALIGWSRFVRPAWSEPQPGDSNRAPLFIMVTYHIGQAGLVLSLADHGLWALLGIMVVMGLVLLTLLDF